jgi:integrase
MSPRPRNPIGTYGTIHSVQVRREKVIDPDGLREPRYVIRALAEGEKPEPGDLWRARARYRFRNGRNKQVERFASTKGAAEHSLKTALQNIDTGSGGSIRAQMKLRDLAVKYLEDRAAVGRAATSLEKYGYAVNVHIIPEIGDLTIQEATPENLQAYLSKIARERGAGAAKNSRGVLSGMLGLAVRNGAAERNPVRELENIVNKTVKGSRPLPLGDAGRFLETIRADEFLIERDLVDFLTFMFSTGWRIGEVCGLTWENVDLDAGTASLERIAVRIAGKGMILQDFGKTDASRRTNTLPTTLVEILGERARSQYANEYNLVFPTVLGKIRDPSNTGREWRKRRDELGFEGITSHSLRKMVATMLDSEGFSARDVADVLGHRNPSMTQDRYMARNTGGAKAAKSLEKMLDGKNESAG